MAGLPFQSLPAAGEAGGPAFEAVDAQGNVTRVGTMQTDPNTGIAEPVYPPEYGVSQPTPAQTDISQTDPVRELEWQGQQAIQQLSTFDQTAAQRKAPVEQKLATSYKQYQIDVEAVRQSGIDQKQQAQQINRLNAQYNKQWVATKDQLEPQITEIQQAKQQAKQKILLDQTLRMHEIKVYADMAARGEISEAASKSHQLRVVGIDVPATEFERVKKVQNPLEQLKDTRNELEQYNQVLKRFRVLPEAKGWSVIDRPRRVQVLKPDVADPEKATDKDWIAASPEEEHRMVFTSEAADRLREVRQGLVQQIGVRRVTDLTGTAGTLALDVRSSMPKSSRGKTLTQADVDALLDEADGDPTRAKQLARARGYKF